MVRSFLDFVREKDNAKKGINFVLNSVVCAIFIACHQILKIPTRREEVFIGSEVFVLCLQFATVE